MEVVPDQLTLFRWTKPREGAQGPEWIDAEAVDVGWEGPSLRSETRWLTWDRSYIEAAEYSPLDDAPEMWRVFVDLEEGEPGYLEFARRYGLLTNPVPISPGELGEPYGRWIQAHRTLRSVWLVYDAVRSKRTKQLAEWIQVDEKSARFVGQPVKGHRINYGRILAHEVFDRRSRNWSRHVMGIPNKAERLRRLGLLWVWRIVNLCMGPRHQHVVSDSFAGDRVSAFLEIDFDTDVRRIRFRPESLLAALWLQLAQTIEGNLVYRQCRYEPCRAWFLLSPVGAGKRQHSQFCSDRCRLREWRRGQARRSGLRVVKKSGGKDAKTRTR